jgi:hypothetical protein
VSSVKYLNGVSVRLRPLPSKHFSYSSVILFYSMALPAHSVSWPLIQFRNHFFTNGRTLWTSDPPVARPLATHGTTQKRRINAHRNPCVKWDSNPRSQRPSERTSSCLFFYLVCETIGTAATPGLLCQPRVIVKMIVENKWNVDWQVKPKFSEKTCPSATFVHHKIPHA